MELLSRQEGLPGLGVPENLLPPSPEPKRAQGRALPKTGFNYCAL